MRNYTNVAKAYAAGIVSGSIPACLQMKQAAQRFLDNLKSKIWRFDEAKAHHACAFIELLPHTKGELARKRERMHLEPWQVFAIVNIFGFVDDQGLRKYREVFLLIPRKNGKSQLAACIALYMAFADGEVGAEVWIGANSMDQAKAVFTPAQKMASIPEFIEATGVEVRAMSVVQESTGNFVQPMIGKPKDGTNPHCAILDEAHEADSSVAYDAMKTGMGARSQPLLITITTAGVNLAGPCKLQQSYAESVLAGQVDNPRLFAAIWTIDQKDDWKDFECWKKANPNLGVSIFEQNLQAAYTEALQRPEKAAMAQTKHLNRWVSSRSAWLNMVDWSKAADTTLDLSKLAKRPATIGTDLATKSDLAVVTARVELEDGRIALFPFCFLPEGALTRAKNSESYQQWREKGHLIVTEGEATDFSEIKAKLLELNSQLAVRMNAFDGWQAQQMMQELMAEGLPVTEVRANVQNFSTPMRDFEAMLLRGELVHPDNLCMNWMAGNVVAKEDARGNLYPRKPDNQPHLKIDGIVTALMAEAVAQEPEPEDNEPFVFIL